MLTVGSNDPTRHVHVVDIMFLWLPPYTVWPDVLLLFGQ